MAGSHSNKIEVISASYSINILRCTIEHVIYGIGYLHERDYMHASAYKFCIYRLRCWLLIISIHRHVMYQILIT